MAKSISLLGASYPDVPAVTLPKTGGGIAAFIESDELQGMVNETITTPAAVMTFPDGADELPMGLKVGIEPVQDLHGYDNPWPAGGGKNLLNTNASSNTINGVTFTVNSDKTISCSGTANGDIYKRIYTDFPTVNGTEYILNGCPSGGSSSKYWLIIYGYSPSGYDFGSGVSFTGDGNSHNIEIVIKNGQNMNGIVFKPMIRRSSVSDATFAPYSNICPISGWTGANVARTGKNLFVGEDKTYYTGSTVASVTEDSITFSMAGAGGTYAYKFGGIHSFSPNKTYTLSWLQSSNNNARVFVRLRNKADNGWLTGDDTTISNMTYNQYYAGWYVNIPTVMTGYRGSFTISVPDCLYAEFGFGWQTFGDIGDLVTFSKIQIEIGSTATEYTPFIAYNTYSITFPSEAGTVYGGTLTVNEDGSGSLVVDRANIASYNGETLPSTWISDRDVYAQGTTPTTGAQVVYMLATPLTPIPLTPGQVKTLLGVNNIWADTGDMQSIEYTVNMPLFIQRKYGIS